MKNNFSNFSNHYRYLLEKGSRKFICPNCGKKTFKRYIDTLTNEYLPEHYGRCDREVKCAYHLNPYTDRYRQKVTGVTKVTFQKKDFFYSQVKPQIQPKPAFFDHETFKQTLQPERYEKNIFIQNLFYNVPFPFDVNDVTKVIELYRLGTIVNGNFHGAITFPFIDIQGNIRAIQVKQFDQHNHTVKTTFLHAIIEHELRKSNKPLPEWLKQYNEYKQYNSVVSCLFGEHLLNKYPNNPIALVEAPKTAIYGTLYFGFPDEQDKLLWLAVYNKSSFKFEKIKVLQGRKIIVLPDLGAYNDWASKANYFNTCLPGTKFVVSDLLERYASESDKKRGLDLADYLIKHDWRLFRKQRIQEQQNNCEKVTKVTEVTVQTNNFFSQLETSTKWNYDITEIETYFNQIELPSYPLRVNDFCTILDCKLFVKNHLATVKNHNGNEAYLPYLERLKEFKELISRIL